MNRREFLKSSAAAGTAAFTLPKALTASPAAGEEVSLGVIGSGARAQEIMAAALQLPGVEITGICDAYQGRASRARAMTGGKARVFDHYHRVLEAKDIDAVIIGTPDHWHRQMALDALAAGKDVYLEKPMTFRVDEGLEIIEAVKRSRQVLQVGSQGISTPTQEMAREMIRARKLGKVTMIRASYNRNTASGAWIYPIPPDAGERTVNWDQFLGPAPRHPFSLERFFRWRCYSDYSGGIATDLFVHLVTSIHFLMDAQMPEMVVASGELYRWKESRDVPDTVNGIMVYPEGFTVNLSSTFNNQSSAESGFEILGTEGSISFRGGQLHFKPENLYEDNRWVVNSWDEKLTEAYYGDPAIQAIETPSTWSPQMKLEGQSYSEWGKESTLIHFGRFIDCVRSRSEPVENAEMGHRAASCAHMVNASIREKRAVHWDFRANRLKA